MTGGGGSGRRAAAPAGDGLRQRDGAPLPSSPRWGEETAEIESRTGRVGRWTLGFVFVGAGMFHLVLPGVYEPAMPPWLPSHRALILLSGVAEVAGGLGVLWPRPAVQRAAGWGLALLLVAVYPANVWMAMAGVGGPAWALWARLPVQGALVAWALAASGAVRR